MPIKKLRLGIHSSGAAKLIAIGDGSKIAAGFWIMYKEAGRLAGLCGATPVCVDASVAIQGTPSEDVSWNMRYSAIRYALLCTLTDSEVVRLVKVDFAEMIADGRTKPLEGTSFARFRDYVLGTPEPATARPTAP